MKNEIIVPNEICCKLCRYQLSDACETCLQDKQFPFFEPRRNLNLEDLPAFPLQEMNNGMSPRMKGIVLGVYIDTIFRTMQEERWTTRF